MRPVPRAVIVAARITPLPKGLGDPLPVVYVTVDGQEERLFDFYPDEISFTASEFVGLTLEQARHLKYSRDVAYISDRQ